MCGQLSLAISESGRVSELTALPEFDESVAASRDDPGARWGLAAALAVGWLVAVEVIVKVLSSHVSVDRVTAYLISIAFESSIGVAVVCALRIGRISGGWRTALGVGRWRLTDLQTVVGWAFNQYMLRFAVVILLAPLLRSGFVSNNPLERPQSALVVVLVFVVAAGVAPVVEELLCRGLLLRAVMRRFGWTSGVLVSSVAFGLAHAYEEPTWRGALYITVVMGTFGVVQCYLVRRTGRLVPAMGVHALVNAVGLILALHR